MSNTHNVEKSKDDSLNKHRMKNRELFVKLSIFSNICNTPSLSKETAYKKTQLSDHEKIKETPVLRKITLETVSMKGNPYHCSTLSLLVSCRSLLGKYLSNVCTLDGLQKT